ncbi:unnamed protein product [Adineta steineri]|uniref:BOD1/SHG1 domain-containing protein n=2 Tax=Adineta steineri TaxID=433720 RepID=A0A819E9Z9_9BILA|nr:unnamed protein product [Adineta steineri]CAF3846744.1 unnamed protein product [Adineta steineri]
MSESYVLHDVMRKVKADGLFDSIRRDLISDIEQKPSYLDLKSQIESLMSSYLSEHKWSPSLKKSDIRERARRHIETSNLIKDTLPSLVNQYMQTCQQQLIQPRLLSFVSDHIEHVYNSIGGTHVYRPPTSYTQSIPIPQEPLKTENNKFSIPIKKEPTIPSKPKIPIDKNPQISNVIKKQIPPKKKPIPIPKESIKEEKKTRILSPTTSPNDLVDISPSSISIENEPTPKSSSPSPPPPIVRIASPLNTESPQKIKRLPESNDDNSTIHIKKKKIKIDDTQQKDIPEEKSEDNINSSSTTTNETDTRKLRPRRPNPKYLNEQFETEDLIISEPSPPLPVLLPQSSTSTISKTKRFRPSKSSTSFDQEQYDTPSSPVPLTFTSTETSGLAGDMSPEYGTSLPSFDMTEKQEIETNDEQIRTPSPVTADTKKTTSPRRLRPRKANERSFIAENQNEKSNDLPMRTSSKTRESSRHRIEPANISSTSDDTDIQQTNTKKTRHSSSSGGDTNSNELPNRSISVPENLNATPATTDETSTTPVSKSFIWKPKISK